MMTRTEFMHAFAEALRTLPRSSGKTLPEPELAAAVQYYEEYLDDAGAGPDDPAPAEMGDPAALAQRIITEAGEDTPPPRAVTRTDSPAFRSVKINVINASVTFLTGSAYHVEIDYPEDRPVPAVELRENTLFIREEPVRRRFRLFSSGGWKSGAVRITVPGGPETSFESFRIETANGGISIPALAIEDLHCETVNGGVNITGVTADRLHGETVNGGIHLADCYAHHICRCETVNGGIHLAGGLRGKTHAETVNGSVRIATALPAAAYNLNLETVSGSIYLEEEKHRREVRIDNHAENDVHAETVNGSIRLNFGK